MTTTPAADSQAHASRSGRMPAEVAAMIRRQHGRRQGRRERGRSAAVVDASREPVDLLRVLGAVAGIVNPCQPHRLRWHAARGAALVGSCTVLQEGAHRLATLQPLALARWLSQSIQASIAAGQGSRRGLATIGPCGGAGAAGVAGTAGTAGGLGDRVALAGWARPVLVPSPSSVRAPLVVWRRLAEWLAMHRAAWGDAAWAAGTVPAGSAWAGRPLSWLAWPGGVHCPANARRWARSAVQAWCRTAGLPHWSGSQVARAARLAGGWPAGVCRRPGLHRLARMFAALAVVTVQVEPTAAGLAPAGGEPGFVHSLASRLTSCR